VFEIKLRRTDKSGNVCWVAHITGTDPRYGLGREFHEAYRREGDRLIYELGTGIYEAAESGERWFFVVWWNETINALRMDEGLSRERVEEMARLMDGGIDSGQARKATESMDIDDRVPSSARRWRAQHRRLSS
jgi:hypothetical protein